MENFAGNIIVNLSNLPDFLRNPILEKRMIEFFSMSNSEKTEIINNALEAGPTVPFNNFSKMFDVWLKILSSMSNDQRREMFARYIDKILLDPQKLIAYNLDGILEIFLKLNKEEKSIIARSIKEIINNLDKEKKKMIMLLMPDNAKLHLGLH